MKAFSVFVSFALTILFLFIFFFLLLRLLQDCIGSIQVNSAMPNRFADCHRLKKGGARKHKRDKENIGFFPCLKFVLIAVHFTFSYRGFLFTLWLGPTQLHPIQITWHRGLREIASIAPAATRDQTVCCWAKDQLATYAQSSWPKCPRCALSTERTYLMSRDVSRT